MKLDEHAAPARDELLARAAARGIPTVDELVGRGRPHRPAARPILAVAAAVAIVVASTVVLVDGDGGPPHVEQPASPLPVPDGVVPRDVEPPGMGVDVEVPTTWEWNGVTRGFDVAYVDSTAGTYLSVSRIPTMDDLDQAAFADLRRDLLVANVGADVGEISRTTVDGHDAVVIDAHWAGIDYTEYGIDLGDRTWAIVALGEQAPVEHGDVLAWVASTIAVDASPLWSTPIDHPATPLPIPDGIAARQWAPEGLGLAVDLPITWADSSAGSEYEFARSSTSGPDTFAFGGRFDVDEADPDHLGGALERQLGADVEESIDTELDGHPVTIHRFRVPAAHEPRLAALDVAYFVDLGDGEGAWLAIGTDGGTPADLIEWIRSTIRVTG
jgi:hypothetical protein